MAAASSAPSEPPAPMPQSANGVMPLVVRAPADSFPGPEPDDDAVPLVEKPEEPMRLERRAQTPLPLRSRAQAGPADSRSGEFPQPSSWPGAPPLPTEASRPSATGSSPNERSQPSYTLEDLYAEDPPKRSNAPWVIGVVLIVAAIVVAIAWFDAIRAAGQ
jgi:hypothetical protein